MNQAGRLCKEQPGRQAKPVSAPSYPIPKKEEHDKRREYPMRQKLDRRDNWLPQLVSFVAANERAHHDRKDRKSKCVGNIERAPILC